MPAKTKRDLPRWWPKSSGFDTLTRSFLLRSRLTSCPRCCLRNEAFGGDARSGGGTAYEAGDTTWTAVRSWEGLGACSILELLVRSDGQALFGTPAWGTSAGRKQGYCCLCWSPTAQNQMLYSPVGSLGIAASLLQSRGVFPKQSCMWFSTKSTISWMSLCCLLWLLYSLSAVSRAGIHSSLILYITKFTQLFEACLFEST